MLEKRLENTLDKPSSLFRKYLTVKWIECFTDKVVLHNHFSAQKCSFGCRCYGKALTAFNATFYRAYRYLAHA